MRTFIKKGQLFQQTLPLLTVYDCNLIVFKLTWSHVMVYNLVF